MESPRATANDAAALRVECALNIAVSIPAVFRKFLIQRPTVFPVTGPNGAIMPIKSIPSLFDGLLIPVRSTYDRRVATGHTSESGQAGSVNDCNGPFRCAFRGFDRANWTEFSENLTDENGIEASSDTRSRVAKASKVANFPTNADIRSALLSPAEVMKLRTILGSHVTLYLGLGGLRL